MGSEKSFGVESISLGDGLDLGGEGGRRKQASQVSV